MKEYLVDIPWVTPAGRVTRLCGRIVANCDREAEEIADQMGFDLLGEAKFTADGDAMAIAEAMQEKPHYTEH